MLQKRSFKIVIKSRQSKIQELCFKHSSSLSIICCTQQFISMHTVFETVK